MFSLNIFAYLWDYSGILLNFEDLWTCWNVFKWLTLKNLNHANSIDLRMPDIKLARATLSANSHVETTGQEKIVSDSRNPSWFQI